MDDEAYTARQSLSNKSPMIFVLFLLIRSSIMIDVSKKNEAHRSFIAYFRRHPSSSFLVSFKLCHGKLPITQKCQLHKYTRCTSTYQVDLKLFCETQRATIIYTYIPICRSIRSFLFFTVHPYVRMAIIVKPKTRKNCTKNCLKNLSEFVSTFHPPN